MFPARIKLCVKHASKCHKIIHRHTIPIVKCVPSEMLYFRKYSNNSKEIHQRRCFAFFQFEIKTERAFHKYLQYETNRQFHSFGPIKSSLPTCCWCILLLIHAWMLYTAASKGVSGLINLSAESFLRPSSRKTESLSKYSFLSEFRFLYTPPPMVCMMRMRSHKANIHTYLPTDRPCISGQN